MKRNGFSSADWKWQFSIQVVVALVCFIGLASNSVVAQELPDQLVEAQNARIAAIAKASSTAVGVFGPGSRGGGSGVVISPDGYALTN